MALATANPIAAATPASRTGHPACVLIVIRRDDTDMRRRQSRNFMLLNSEVECVMGLRGEDLRQYWNVHQSRRFINPEHDVHALHTLPGSSLYEIVFDNQNYQQITAARTMYGNPQFVGRTYRTRFGMTAGSLTGNTVKPRPRS